jgi:hypothetical protein
MRIGVIYCCYGNPEYIQDCLAPWLEAKKTNEILIAAVHGQFKEYRDMGIPDNDLESKRILNILHREGDKIDYLYIQNNYTGFSHWQTESEIRNNGLQWLLEQKCDIIWLLDNDEFYTVEQIKNIISYIQKDDNKFYSWFSIPMRNYIFSGKEWISGFAPPRIFKRETIRYTLNKCVWDNDFQYLNDKNEPIDYKQLPSKTISENTVAGGVKHLTWTHENGELKEKYQRLHFNGICSYKFNKETQKLEFDLEFYKKNGLSLPIINKDDE